ncbi:hypothetical protein [Brevibacillus laterosporus]|uniref:hypothetical protein n=1 Tax=Brevibacillus laterosporus TaxID=1465 RepID=UPI00215D0BE4|nr:hypothetical protein [Brevibacillus laterosporus]MCR8994665.1 hypothetical protein [Brevibacillus laterosporus]
MIFAKSNGTHPIQTQEFIWVADYNDGTSLTEFDLQTHTSDPYRFYSIDKSKLIRFGLIGNGTKMFFEVANGVFNINGHQFRVYYVVDGKEYNLSGSALIYNDIITYKDCVSEAIPLLTAREGAFNNRILQYNYGYKKTLTVHGVEFNYQAIVSVPFNKEAYMSIKITPDHDLNGKIVIRRGGAIVDEFEAPLKAGCKGNINWTLR